mgnify:CR=1 FL=1
MATIGMLFFLEEVTVHATAGMPQPYPAMPYDEYFEFGQYSIRGDLVVIFLLCLIATALLLFMLYRKRLGLAPRAVAQGRRSEGSGRRGGELVQVWGHQGR